MCSCVCDSFLCRSFCHQLRGYIDDWFVGRRITLVGIGEYSASLSVRSPSCVCVCWNTGVDHQELVSIAESSFSSVREGDEGEETCHYYGGSIGRVLIHACYAYRGQ